MEVFLLLCVGGLIGAMSMHVFPKMHKEPEVKAKPVPVDTSHEGIKQLRKDFEDFVTANNKISNVKLLDAMSMLDRQQTELSAKFSHVCEDMRNQNLNFKTEMLRDFWNEMKSSHAATKTRDERVNQLHEKIADLSPYHRHLHLDRAKDNKQFQAQAEHQGMPIL